MIEEEAGVLIEKHGEKAPQILVDALVNAVRCGDESRITRLDKTLREIDGLLAERQRHL